MKNRRTTSWCGWAALALSGIALAQTGSATSDHLASDKPAFNPPPESLKQYSAKEINTMVERPTTVSQLLRNIKVVMDRDLLLQQGFFDDANLVKFFNGTHITRRKQKSDSEVSEKLYPAPTVVTVTSAAFPKMIVKTYLANHDSRSPTSHELVIEAGHVPGFTASEVMSAFGPPSEKEFDTGELTDGHSQTPLTKGSYKYETRWTRFAGPYFEKRVVVYIELDVATDPSLRQQRPAFKDADLVKEIRLHESK
jgi:hypothetical protein